MKKILITIVILLNCYIATGFLNQVSAAFSFWENKITPETISSKDEEVIVELSITDLPSESYFRVALQKSDGTDYFGYMKNDLGEWVKASDKDCSKFYHATDTATTNLEILLKIGDYEVESGVYNIKAHRYTSSCKSNTAAINSFPIEIALPTNTPTPKSSPTPTSPFLPTPTVYTTPGVLLTEVMVYPDNESEWAEIYNPQDSSVTLNGWYLDDGQNSGSSPKSFSLTIPAKSYKVIYLNTQIFNNSADTIRLLNSEFAEIDGFDYDGAEKSQSFSRQSLTKDDSWCLTNPSPNEANSTCLQTISGLTDTKITEPTPTVIPTEISKIIQSESSIIPPAGLILSDNFYKLPQPKVLGAKTSPPCFNQAELVFWQQFTKISLWLNLLISVLFLIHLSFSLPVFSRFYAG